MELKKTNLKGILALIIILFSNHVDAVVFDASCKVSATRSAINISGKGFTRTALYAIVYNYVVGYRSKFPNKIPDATGSFIYEFDSNPTEIATGETQIPANYNKGKQIMVLIRRASDNYLMGGSYETCIPF